MQPRFSICNATMFRASCSNLLLVLFHLYLLENSLQVSEVETFEYLVGVEPKKIDKYQNFVLC